MVFIAILYYQNEIFNEETKINAKQNEDEYGSENAFLMISVNILQNKPIYIIKLYIIVNIRQFELIEFLKLEKQILWHLVLKNIRISELGKIKRARSQSIINKDLETLGPNDKNLIYNRWVKFEYTQTFDYSILWKYFLPLVLIILIILYKNRQLLTFQKKLKNTKEE